MPKNHFRFPKGLEIERLKKIYKPIVDQMTNVSQEQKNNFYDLVIPSLADPVVMNEISLNPRFKCLFKVCLDENKSFSSKQKFIQHLAIIHDQELPQGGAFIAPKDNSIKPGGFWCSKCGHHYCRRDHLQNHIKSNVHCREAIVLDQNPLEQRDLEYETTKAIEFSRLSEENKDFKFEHQGLLAIEWKPVVVEQKTSKSIKSLANSLSMLTLASNRRKPRLEKKSHSLNINLYQIQIEPSSPLKPLDFKRKCVDDSDAIVKKIKLESNENISSEKSAEELDDKELLKSLLDYENKKINC